MNERSRLVEVVNPDSLMTARGFSHACIAQGGRTLYIAGQVAADKTGLILHHHDLVAQFDLTLQNFKTCLDAVGAQMNQVVKLNYFVLDVQDYLAKRKELGPVYRKYFDRHFPAMTLAEVKGLYNEGALIEIDGVAALD
jgi:enamine deaminase RidA (YjgF/YER057c/UK114 family)